MPTVNIASRANWNDLIGLTGDYLQTASFDASAGLDVIGTGTGAGRFTGTYNGGGYSITNVAINESGNDYQGLFGSTYGATISNIANVTGAITGQDYVGMIGRNYTSTVSICKCSAAITARNYSGGICGYSTGTITNCYTTGNAVSSTNYSGGICSWSGGATAAITNCYATGNATAMRYAAAAVGYNSTSAAISFCFGGGAVSATSNIGGLTSFDAGAAATGSWLPVAQMKNPLWYIAAAWDLAATWVMTRVQANITGMTVPEATALLTAQGCTLSVTSYNYDATVPAGQILTQSIAAGGTAGYPQLQAHGMPASPRTGDVVAVTVSLGSSVPVPNTLGKTEADAISYLSDFYFTATVVEATSETVEAGLVMDQDPAGGTNATYQSAVTITVSTGHADVVVPDVVGQTFAAAVDAAEAVGLDTVIFGAYSETVPIGLVVSQSPDAGDVVARGSEFVFTVSLGVQQAIVPDVVGETLFDATMAIEAVGLVASVTYAYHATIAAGLVISQTPDAGISIEVGADVCIVVSLGIEPAIVPYVTGEYYLTAGWAIENAGLVYASTRAYSETVEAGYIIEQDPAAGTSQVTGSTVTVTKSRGAEVTGFNAVRLVAEFLEDALYLSAESGDLLHQYIAMDRLPPDFENETQAISVQEQSGAPAYALVPAVRRQIAIKHFGGTADFDGCCEVFERVKAILHNHHGAAHEGGLMFAELVTTSRYYEPDTGWPVILAIYQVETIETNGE